MVERFSVKGWNDDHIQFADPEGKWVHYSDYAALEADLERKHEAFVIASDQAMENGNALTKAKLALDAIVERSHNDPLGTSKVNDMREMARRTLEELESK